MRVQEIFDLIEKEISPQEKELISKAYSFAKEAHEGQKRMSGDPYFIHPFETAKILARMNNDPTTIAAGLLHDVLEDASRKITEEEVEKEFNSTILFLVLGVTKLGKIKYSGYERHAESLRKFFVAIAKDLRVVIIKFADRLHNLKTLQFVREDKRKRIALESLEIYAPLANRLGMGKLKGELEDAAFPHVYPQECKETEELLEEKKSTYKDYLVEASEELKQEFKKNKMKILGIDYRIKHNYSLWRKLLKHNMNINEIYDIIALRIIVENVESCYRVLGIIHSLWAPLPGRIKDYIAVPKINGYQSLHTTVFTGSDGIVEIQIRTQKMDTEAEYGVAAHFSYKEGEDEKKTNKKNKLKLEWLRELKNIKYTPDVPDQFIEDLKMDFFSDRIFIFTPTGDVIDLPENSTPIDFAYAIHSDLGDHISGTKINNKMCPIFSRLNNGDIVEIIKNKKAHPSKKWLEYARTNTAQKNIRSYLQKNSLLTRLESFQKFRR